MATHYCGKCNKMLDEKEFYTSKLVDKFPPDGKMSTCKKCLTMHVDNWDPETYKWILEEIDVPYIKEEWDALLAKYGQDPKKVTGVTILGRYLSKMKLKQWSKYTYADTEVLEEKARQEKMSQMKAQGMSNDEINERLSQDTTPPKPKEFAAAQSAVGTPEYYNPEDEVDDFSDSLTEEDKLLLRLKWGRGYRAEEWVRLEQLYKDFEGSYDIQTAGHKDTLIMVCKASLKANQLFDAGDIDGAQKMTKVYNDLMKSGNFTAAQNKGDSGEFVDSVGELILLAEKEGFIPRYYTDGPQDKVDQTLLDMQHYTHNLVIEEMNLGNMIEASLKQIVKDKERESKISLDDGEEDTDDSLFEYREDIQVTDQDYSEYFDSQEQQRLEDDKYLEDGGQ